MIEQAPAVSVLICTYNRAHSLRGALGALQHQDLDPGLSLELIVVDNNSTDHTRAVVHDIAQTARWPVRYLIESQQGKSYALNRGVREATGTLIAICDDDQVPDRGWLRALWHGYQAFDADAVGGPIRPRWAVPPPAWLLDPRLQAHIGLLDRGERPLVAVTGDTNFLHGGNSAFRKAVLDDVGPFRTDLGPAGKRMGLGEDTELIARIGRAGKKILYVPDAVMFHHVPAERMRVDYLRRWRFRGGRATIRMAPEQWRRVPWWLIRECLGNALTAAWHYLRWRPIEGLKAESQFWGQLGMLAELLRIR